MSTDNKVRVVFEAQLDKFKSGVKSAVKDVANIGNEGRRSSEKMTFAEARQGINSFSSEVSSATSNLKALVATYLGMKTINFLFVEPTRKAIEFEKQMSRVLAISGATQEEFEALKESAKDLGNTTQFTATQVAEAQTNLAVAGFNANEIIAAMPGLLDLSAASASDLGTASEIAAATLRGFGLDASEATRVADIFAVATTSSAADVNGLGEAMKYIAPTARGMGITIEETTAAIGILSDAGIRGSSAGTVLRGALAGLASPSGQATKIIKELGFSAFDAQGDMRSLTDIVRDLEGSLADYTSEARQQAIIAMFGLEAMSGMVTLIENGADSLDDFTQSLIDSNGAAKNMADIMLDNTAGAIIALQSRFEAFQLQVGERIMPILHSQLLRLLDTIDQMAENGAIDRVAESLGRIAIIILEQFEIALERLPQIIETLANWIEWLANHFEVISNAVIALGISFISLKTIILLLNAVMAATPVGLAITAIGVLTAGVIYLRNTSEEFKNTLLIIFNAISVSFLYLIKGMVNGINWVAETLNSLLGQIPLIGNAFNAMANVTRNALANIDGRINTTIGNLQRLLRLQQATGTGSGVPNSSSSLGGVKNSLPSPEIPALLQDFTQGSKTFNSLSGNPSNVGSRPSGGSAGNGGSNGTATMPSIPTVVDNRTALQKGMDEVEESFRYRIDLEASRINLAKAEEDDEKVLELSENKVNILREQLEGLEVLSYLAKDDKERSVLEIAQNRIATQIINILESINDTVEEYTNELVGEFNSPSGLSIMNQYQYETRNSENFSIGRYISTPTINMYLRFKDLGGEAGKSVKDELNNFTNALFDLDSKNDNVRAGLLDVLRN